MVAIFSCCNCGKLGSTSGYQDDKNRSRASPIHENEAATVLAPEQIDLATSEPELEANDTPVVTSPPESFDRTTDEGSREGMATRQVQSPVPPEEPREDVGVEQIEQIQSSLSPEQLEVSESQEVVAAGVRVAPAGEPEPSDAVAENNVYSGIPPEMAQGILIGLPLQARFEHGDSMVDTFIEFRSWLRLTNQRGNLVAAGSVLDVSFKRSIFGLLAAVAQNRLRQNLAREAFVQLASIDEWVRGGALDDATFLTAMGEMPGQSLHQRDQGIVQSTRASPTNQATSSQQNDASQQPGLQESQEEVSEPWFTGAEPASEGGEDEIRQATTTTCCVICSDAPAIMTFVHGSSGHTACCPACAAQIQQRGYRRCPVCRQRFSSVIRNFGV